MATWTELTSAAEPPPPPPPPCVQISVSQDDTVTVVDSLSGIVPQTGWTQVETSNGSVGIVPTDYLRIASTGGSAGSGSLRLPVFPCRATVKYDFVGETEGELTVSAGEGLMVLSELDGWFQVRRQADSAAGLVPVSYLQLGQ